MKEGTVETEGFLRNWNKKSMKRCQNMGKKKR